MGVCALRYYLLARVFTLYSDHAPPPVGHYRQDHARITRWYLALQPFNLRVVHRPGAQMAMADFLSRSGEGGVVMNQTKQTLTLLESWFQSPHSTVLHTGGKKK